MPAQTKGSARAALAVAALAAVLAAPPRPAAAHDGPTHRQADEVVHTAADEPRLEALTSRLTALDAANAAAAIPGDPGNVGRWGPVTSWPVVGVHVALLPNGMVLAFDSVGDRAAQDYTVHDRTRATVWDPATGTQTPVTEIGDNIFCSGMAHLPDGSLFVAGGTLDADLHGIVQTHDFDPGTNTWSLGPVMAAGRWYPSVTPLRDGETLITAGGPPTPEVRTRTGKLRALRGATLPTVDYPWLDVGPDGRAFMSGPGPTMRALDADGTGAWRTLGARDSLDRSYGSHAMYDVGKILVAGGGPSSADARVIDINGRTPRVSATAPMAYGRRQHNLTVLADGSVLATGGNSSGAHLVDLANGVYPAERWDPATGRWTTLAAMEVTRQYHSTALLLADGRVLTAGGGVCATCDEVGYLAKDAQVFSPPYLYKRDGSGQLARRPVIASAPAAVAYGSSFDVATPEAGAIRKLALVRLGAVTHSVNMEQRYVPLAFTAGSGRLSATAPRDGSLAPPGVYMLFAVDDHGVPSIATMVRVDAAAAAPPEPASAPPEPASAPPHGGGVSGVTVTHAGRFVALPARLRLRAGRVPVRLRCLPVAGCTGRLSVSRLRRRAGRVRVRVRCLQSVGCTGRLSVERADRGGRPVLLGTRRAAIPGQGARTFAVFLRRARLEAGPRLRVRIEFSGLDAARAPRRIARRATLRRR